MRRIPAVVAVLGLSALALVGCSSTAPAASCDRADSDSSALDLIEVSGATGSAVVTVAPPVYVEKTVFTDAEVGDGPAVTSRAQDVQFTATIVDGESGETLVSAGTQAQPVAEWATYYEGIAKMLECATEGSRIVGAVAPDDLSDEANANLGLADGQAAVIVLDLERVFLAAADGAPQFNDRRGMPSVVLAPDGRPGVIVPDAAPPTDLVVEVLKKGAGEPVTAEAPARIHYTGVTWDDGEVFDSTWEKGASASVTLDGVVPGFAQALEGQTVGSQLLVVIPPDLGYGAQGSGAVPADATLVFVIDILGLDEVAATP